MRKGDSEDDDDPRQTQFEVADSRISSSSLLGDLRLSVLFDAVPPEPIASLASSPVAVSQPCEHPSGVVHSVFVVSMKREGV